MYIYVYIHIEREEREKEREHTPFKPYPPWVVSVVRRLGSSCVALWGVVSVAIVLSCVAHLGLFSTTVAFNTLSFPRVFVRRVSRRAGGTNDW